MPLIVDTFELSSFKMLNLEGAICGGAHFS
jgi:hypothetical protein